MCSHLYNRKWHCGIIIDDVEAGAGRAAALSLRLFLCWLTRLTGATPKIARFASATIHQFTPLQRQRLQIRMAYDTHQARIWISFHFQFFYTLLGRSLCCCHCTTHFSICIFPFGIFFEFLNFFSCTIYLRILFGFKLLLLSCSNSRLSVSCEIEILIFRMCVCCVLCVLQCFTFHLSSVVEFASHRRLQGRAHFTSERNAFIASHGGRRGGYGWVGGPNGLTNRLSTERTYTIYGNTGFASCFVLLCHFYAGFMFFSVFLTCLHTDIRSGDWLCKA